MDYQQSLDFLYSQLPMFSRIGAPAYKPGLDTSLNLDNFFGHPHRRFRSFHIAGTNGKGSTSHMLAAILQSQGYRTALYTSPHLVDFRERMRIDGKMIPKEDVVSFVEKWRNSGYPGHPSFFELTMMMAFDWFASQNVDFAIIEVGMGGRLDSTNIITPEACAITNISKDHTQFLGATLPEIAMEKAGIMKKGIPVVIGEAEGDVRKVFENHAAEIGAPITFSSDTRRILSVRRADDGGWEGESKEGKWHSPLGGDYQLHNIETVLHAVDAIRKCGVRIDDEAVCKGISEVDTLTGLRGRWSILSRKPLTIADTGHNIAGIESNMKQLQELLAKRPGSRLRFVIGFVADKDIDNILRLLPHEADYYITNAAIPRALPADKLHERFLEAGLDGRTFPTVAEAYETALAESAPSDILYIGGSTFIVADLLASLK